MKMVGVLSKRKEVSKLSKELGIVNLKVDD